MSTRVFTPGNRFTRLTPYVGHTGSWTQGNRRRATAVRCNEMTAAANAGGNGLRSVSRAMDEHRRDGGIGISATLRPATGYRRNCTHDGRARPRELGGSPTPIAEAHGENRTLVDTPAVAQAGHELVEEARVGPVVSKVPNASEPVRVNE